MTLKAAKHIFKNGNSYAIRISKRDREQLKIDESSDLVKTISPDNKTISFTVVNHNKNQEVDDFAKKFMADHKKAFDVLKDM